MKPGQVLVYIDSDSINAQLRQAEAQAHQTQNVIATALSQLAQREAERIAAQAVDMRRAADRGGS